MYERKYQVTEKMRLVTAKNGGLHIANEEKTYCGLSAVEIVAMDYSEFRPTKPNGHSYGDELMKSAACKKCKTKATRSLSQLYYYSKEGRKELYKDTFRMFRAPRPLPQRKSMGGVNTIMSNVRERVRRKSEDAYKLNRLWTIKTSWGDSFVSTWGKQEHAAIMLGVNYAIEAVFDSLR